MFGPFVLLKTAPLGRGRNWTVHWQGLLEDSFPVNGENVSAAPCVEVGSLVPRVLAQMIWIWSLAKISFDNEKIVLLRGV